MANQPIIKKRDKATSIAIFRDEYTNAQGEIKNRFSVSIQRSYKDKSGEWKQTSLNCFLEDLLPISTLCLRSSDIAKAPPPATPTSAVSIKTTIDTYFVLEPAIFSLFPYSPQLCASAARILGNFAFRRAYWFARQ